MKTFPIIGGKYLRAVPWVLLDHRDERAVKNHGQSVAQLASRGGLGPKELLAVIDNVPFASIEISEIECEAELLRIIKGMP